MKRKLCILLLFVTSVTFSQTWTGGGGTNTNWNNLNNWDNGAVPGPTNDVIVPSGFTVTLNVAGNVKSIEVQGNSVLEINANLTFITPSNFGANTTIKWSTGALNGTGSTISNLGTLLLLESGTKIISGDTTFNNSGILNITSSGDLWITQGVLNNQISGVIDMQAENGNITWSGGSSHVLNNVGLIKRTTSGGEAQIVVELNNNGTIEVESGTLSFQNDIGKKFTNGIYNVSAGATMDWDANMTLSDNISGTINGTLNWTSSVEVLTAATLNFIGSGTVNWISNNLKGGGTLTNLGTINLWGSGTKSIIEDTTFNNEGNINVIGSGDLSIVQGIVNNQATGVIDMRVDNGDITFSGGNSHILNNVGLIKRTASTGEAQIVVELNNLNGKIQVESGILSFQNATGKNLTDGTYNVFAGARMDWDTTMNLSGTIAGTIDGTLNWINNVEVITTASINFIGSGAVNWVSGSLIGGGTLNQMSVLNLTGNATKIITDDTTLSNSGTLNLTTSGDLAITQGILNNLAVGVIDMQADAGNITWSGGNSHILNNAGLIKRTTSSGEAQIVVMLNNNGGTVQVENGTLSFVDSIGKNLTDGTYNVFSGAVLDWDGTVNPLGTLTGAIEGTLNWNNIVNIPMDGAATFNFSGSGNFNWTGNQLLGGGTLTNMNTLNLTGGGTKIIAGDTTLNNSGNINLTSSGDLWITQGVLNNQTAGVIDMQADAGNITWSGGTIHILNNAGLIKRTTSTGEAQIVVELNNNNGTVQVESGILSFVDSIGKNLTDGTYNVFSGAVLDWDGTVNPLGTLNGVIDGTLNWNDMVNIPVGGEATFNFTGSGNFNWNTGQLQGGGILSNLETINLSGNGTKIIAGNTTLNNSGIINHTSLGDLWITQGVLNNQTTGIMDLQADAGNISYSGGTSHILNNAGLIKRTTSTGLVQLYVQINNSGTIEVVSGELEIADSQPFVNEETGIIKGTGIFDLPPVSNYTNNGTFAPGLSPGILNVQGDFKSTSTSLLDIELNGLVPGTEHDVLAITGNNVVFEGNVAVTMGFEAAIGDSFIIATTSGTIATANLSSPIGNVDFDGFRYVFEVTYPDNNKVVLTIIDKLDILAPNGIAQNITVALNSSGNAIINANQIDNGSTDNDTPTNELQFSLDKNTFTCAELGDNTVQLTVTDNANNFITLSATVTVVDVMAPNVVTQDITVMLDDLGNAKINVSQIDNGSSDNCSIASLSLDLTDFTCADLGLNTVNLIITDQSGNSSFAPATVDVKDAISPTLTCLSDFALQNTGAFVLPDYFANNSIKVSDNCTVVTKTQTPAAGTLLGDGNHVISFEVADADGNTNTCSFILSVDDTLSSDSFVLSENDILVFPNPVADILTIKNTGNLKLVDLEIIDVTGKMLNRIDLSNMGIMKEVSFKNYSQGMYFIKVKSFNSSLTKRIMKQ